MVFLFFIHQNVSLWLLLYKLIALYVWCSFHVRRCVHVKVCLDVEVRWYSCRSVTSWNPYVLKSFSIITFLKLFLTAVIMVIFISWGWKNCHEKCFICLMRTSFFSKPDTWKQIKIGLVRTYSQLWCYVCYILSTRLPVCVCVVFMVKN